MSKTLVPSHLMVPAGTGSLDAYIQEVNKVPMLTLEEEKDLAARYLEEGDLDAARRLVLAHLRFVVHVAKGYGGYGLQLGDLIQEGNIGLMKAVKRFDPTLNYRKIDFAMMRRLLSIGIPAGFQYFFEVSAFAASSVMLGWIRRTSWRSTCR